MFTRAPFREATMAIWLLRLHHHDERFLHALVLRRRPRLDRAMRAVTHLGDAAATVGLVLLLLASTEWRSVGQLAAFALISSHLAVQLLKRTISRARPRLPVGVASLVQAPDRFSFPSGHAASSLSVALAVAASVPSGLATVVMMLACVVGLSRCYLGVHYPGDVMMGWCLGAGGTLAGAMLLG